jgi:hypothetical protein
VIKSLGSDTKWKSKKHLREGELGAYLREGTLKNLIF